MLKFVLDIRLLNDTSLLHRLDRVTFRLLLVEEEKSNLHSVSMKKEMRRKCL